MYTLSRGRKAKSITFVCLYTFSCVSMFKREVKYTLGIDCSLAIRNAEYATLLAVGIICPPPLWIGSPAITASRILNFTLRMAAWTMNTQTIFPCFNFTRSYHHGGNKVFFKEGDTYVRHTVVLPWYPTGSLGQWSLSQNQVNSCPPGNAQIMTIIIMLGSLLILCCIAYPHCM